MSSASCATPSSAASRKKHLTLVHKHNVLVNAGHMWRRIVDEVGEEYPDVRVDYCHIDAATIYMVTDPARFDVIVTDNLFGDILTDEAGGRHRRHRPERVGVTSTPRVSSPPCSSPCTVPHPTSQGRGRPIRPRPSASVALMLDFMGFTDEAARVRAAIDADMAARAEAAASGSPLVRSTSQIGDDIAARL